MSLTIDEILRADDGVVEKVECPEWGGHVYVRSMTGDERDKLETDLAAIDKQGMRARIFASCLCQQDGTPAVPSDAEVIALGKKSAAPMERCLDTILRINGMRESDIEGIAKN